MAEYIRKARQLTVVADDKAGLLAEVSWLLAKNRIDIRAISAFGLAGKAFLYLVCSDARKAKSLCLRKGWQAREEEVVVVGLENRTGALARLSARLKAKKVNLLYCYGSDCDCSCACRFVFKASDNDRAIAALKK